MLVRLESYEIIPAANFSWYLKTRASLSNLNPNLWHNKAHEFKNMRGFAYVWKSPSILPLRRPLHFSPEKTIPSALVCTIGCGYKIEHSVCTVRRTDYDYRKEKRKRGAFRSSWIRASGRESPHEVLGVPASASVSDIKRAYRRLALKYHPDVNKEADAKEKFMRIKNAYNTMLTTKSRGEYDVGNQGSGFSESKAGRYKKKSAGPEEDFYGFEDFFRDLQEEFRSWEATIATQGKPKSLWEELADIGEEFVEFLEKELSITDAEVSENPEEMSAENDETIGTKRSPADQKETNERSNIGKNMNMDEIEAALAQLKRELGL